MYESELSAENWWYMYMYFKVTRNMHVSLNSPKWIFKVNKYENILNNEILNIHLEFGQNTNKLTFFFILFDFKTKIIYVGFSIVNA